MGRVDALHFQCPVKCPPDVIHVLAFFLHCPQEYDRTRSRELGTRNHRKSHLEGFPSNIHSDYEKNEKENFLVLNHWDLGSVLLQQPAFTIPIILIQLWESIQGRKWWSCTKNMCGRIFPWDSVLFSQLQDTSKNEKVTFILLERFLEKWLLYKQLSLPL